jgi:hypothetical protein
LNGETLFIPAFKKLVVAIAIGYPDRDSKLNQFKSTLDLLGDSCFEFQH